MMQTPLSLNQLFPGPRLGGEDLLAHFAKWQVPDDFVFIDALPRTSTGKFLKTRLRQDFKGWISKTPD